MAWTDHVVRDVLPNGLTLLIARDPSAPVVSVVTHVKAGYFDEPDEWVGIAHVLEHMFFKGTERLGPGELARATQLAGGYLNAGTIYDKTVYYAVTPSARDGLARTIALQSDALTRLALEPGELGRELEVIIQEAKRKLDSPGAVTAETLYELLFRVHRMRRWRIGTEAGLRRLTAADVRAYYRSRYTPHRTIVGLAGDLDPDRALDLARAAYGAWTPAESEVPGSPVEPPGAHPVQRVLRGDVERPLAALGWKTVGPLHDDAAALDLAAEVLGTGRGALLARAVRMPGLVGAIGCAHFTPGDVGVFEVSLSSDADKVDRALDRTLEVVGALGADGVAVDELERARALVATQWARRFESMDGRATALCEFEGLGNVALADRCYERIMEVTPDDVRRVAREYLATDRASCVLYLPERTAGGVPAGPWPPAVRPRPPAPIVTERVSIRRNGGPPAGAHGHAGGTTHFALRGADLLVHPKRGSGLVSLGVYFAGVTTHESRETAGLSWLLARAAIRGAGGRDAETLAQAAEALGGSLTPAVGTDAVGWALTAEAKHAAEAAQLLFDVAAEPSLVPDDVVIERGLQADDAARIRDDMYRYPSQRALHEAFGWDPYGLPALGEPDTVRTYSPEQVAAWGERLRGARAIAVAVGDLNADQLGDALGVFRDWSGTGGVDPRPAPSWHAGRAAEPRAKAQTALAMAFPAPRYASSDRFTLDVMAALLSGLAGRLFDELRERRALAYTVHAAPWLKRRAGVMLTYIATSPEREDEAREAMLAELARVGATPVGEGELRRARNYAAGLRAIARQRARAVAGEILEAWIYGTLDDLDDEPERLRTVTATGVMETAARIFDPDRRAEYVVRGAGRSR